MKTSVLYLITLTTLIIVVSCQKHNELTPNLPPLPFKVTATPSATGNDVILNWTKATDPNGDPVTYAVVYQDTLIKNLTDTTFTIQQVGYNTSVAGTIVASDNKKATVTASFTLTSSPFVLIPDIVFEQQLINLKIDDILDGKVLATNAQKVTSLNLNRPNSSFRPIFTLQGLDAFINLISLSCNENKLSTLDISRNNKLTGLSCDGNSLTTLDISKNTELVNLYCGGIFIKNLDLSKNIKLQLLYCPFCQLTNLDITQNGKLTTLDCRSNQFSSLDLSHNAALDRLNCGGNKLTSLDLSNNTALTEVYTDKNQLNSLDISKNIALINVICSNNQLLTLDVSQSKDLLLLVCSNNQLTSLDLRSNHVLKSLTCQGNKINAICVDDLSVVKTNWQKDSTTTYQVCK